MDYMGLTEEEMLEAIANADSEMEADKNRLHSKLRDLGIREDEIMKRMKHFEATYLIRKIIAENNRRLTLNLETALDEHKKDIFI